MDAANLTFPAWFEQFRGRCEVSIYRDFVPSSVRKL